MLKCILPGKTEYVRMWMMEVMIGCMDISEHRSMIGWTYIMFREVALSTAAQVVGEPPHLDAEQAAN